MIHLPNEKVKITWEQLESLLCGYDEKHHILQDIERKDLLNEGNSLFKMEEK